MPTMSDAEETQETEPTVAPPVELWKPPDPNTAETVLNFSKRKNSVCIDLSAIPRPVRRSETVDLIKNVLKLNVDKIVDVSVNSVRRILLIKFSDEETQKMVQDKLDENSLIWPEHKIVLSGWMCQGRTVAVYYIT